MSKGFKRRVGLAQALIHDPEISNFDEPTDGLDPNQKNEVRKLIRKLGREKAVIISTHVLEEVNAICNRAMIINNGKILIDDKPNEILRKSSTFNSIYLCCRGKNSTELKKNIIENKITDDVKVIESLHVVKTHNSKNIKKN